jgi:three-Cys-motif partner protein
MGNRALPDSYANRGQAFIKHTLLKSYLEKLFLILGTGARNSHVELCYIDCFAGPWGDVSESMESTSIAISLRTIEKCRQQLAGRGIKAKMRASFIEKDRRAFERLREYLSNSTPVEISAECRQGDFVALRQDILNWAGRDAFVFFFVDPMGWKEAGIEVLRPLLARPRSELLVNFMYNFLNRTMSNPGFEKEMKELVGEKLDLSGKSPDDRERLILSTYRSNLKSCVPVQNEKYPARSGYVRVLHSIKDRTWYHLVYVTSHPKGIVEFMEMSETVDLVQKQVRASTKEAKREEITKMKDMFTDDDESVESLGRASEADVDRFWLAYLAGGQRRVDLSQFGDILEETDWFPSDLQASLGRLIKAGSVRNLDADANRPKRPLHYEVASGERLELSNRQ